MKDLVFNKGDLICKDGKAFAKIIAINPMNNPERTCIKVFDKKQEHAFNTENDKNNMQYVNTMGLNTLLRRGDEFTLNTDKEIDKDIQESLRLAGVQLNEDLDANGNETGYAVVKKGKTTFEIGDYIYSDKEEAEEELGEGHSIVKVTFPANTIDESDMEEYLGEDADYPSMEAFVQLSKKCDASAIQDNADGDYTRFYVLQPSQFKIVNESNNEENNELEENEKQYFVITKNNDGTVNYISPELDTRREAQQWIRNHCREYGDNPSKYFIYEEEYVDGDSEYNKTNNIKNIQEQSIGNNMNKIYVAEVVYDSANGDGNLWDVIPWSFAFKTEKEAKQAKGMLEEHYKKIGYNCIASTYVFDINKLSTIESLKKELENDAKSYGDGEEEDNEDTYDADHAAEWMERNPHGYYNSEKDYGTDDEERYETCSWCGERYPLSDLRKEKDMGYVCNHCAKGIESREGDLEFEDDDEDYHNNLFLMQ